MRKIKGILLLSVALLFVLVTTDSFISDAQTKRGGGQKPPGSTTVNKNKMVPLPIRPGVDYSKFDHASHSPDCQTCHTSGAYTERMLDYPKHPACEECHSIPVFTLGARGFCIICHEKDLVTVKKEFPEQKEDQFGTKFPHSIHVGLDAKDFNLGNITVGDAYSEDDLKLQQVVKSSGCLECHVKDGKEKKEENLSMPKHPECARCHGIAPKNIPPAMNECLECHKPYLAPRKAIQDIVPKFRHDKDHEKDTRPDAKKGASLDCKFCHKEAAASKRMQDITPPYVSNCTICHNNGKKASGHELTPAELINMRPDPVKEGK